MRELYLDNSLASAKLRESDLNGRISKRPDRGQITPPTSTHKQRVTVNTMQETLKHPFSCTPAFLESSLSTIGQKFLSRGRMS